MRRATRIIGLAVAPVLMAGAPSPAGTSPPETPTCEGREATLVGTHGADELTGTTGADVIVGLGGDDVVVASGGDDVVCAGPGSDRVSGGTGADRLRGEGDRLAQDAGGSYLLGDVLVGGGGDDVLLGGYDARSVGSRRLVDTVSYADAPTGVVVDLSVPPGRATGRGTDTIGMQQRLRVVGSAHADTIVGSYGADHLDGGDGPDQISGLGGNDTIFGEQVGDGPGSDLLRGGDGHDLLGSYSGRDDIVGGTGRDFVEAYSNRPADVRAGGGDDYVAQHVTRGSGTRSEGGPGRDVLALHGRTLAGEVPRPWFTIDLRSGTTTLGTDPAGIGTIVGFEEHRLAGDLRWRFHGTPGPDRLWAITGGPLRAETYAGNDWVRGSPLDDFVHAGPGTDRVDGGTGRDVCRSAERGTC